MAGRHYEHPLQTFEKFVDQQSKEISRLYLQKLVRDRRSELEDFLRDPPSSDSFGNAYRGTREEAIRCFLNNFAIDMEVTLTLQECIHEINSALGWEGELENEQYRGNPIAGNEVAHLPPNDNGFINWLKRLFD